MNLILLLGYPGIGKFTVARELSEKTGYGFFYTHAFLQSIYRVFDYEADAYHDFLTGTMFNVVKRAATDGLPGLIVTFGMDPKVPDEHFQKLFDVSEQSGGTVSLVQLWCDEDEHKARIKGGERASQGKFTAPDMVSDLRSEAGERDFGRSPFLLDTTGLSSSETVVKLMSELNLMVSD